MIVTRPEHLNQIAEAAEAAYPEECCGLLIGRGDGASWRLERVAASANVAEGDRRRVFEVDPRLLLTLQRELRGTAQRIIGVYHSHADGPPEPSAADLDRAWEPGLVWVITSVRNGRAARTTAHVLVAERGRFDEIPLRLLASHGRPR